MTGRGLFISLEGGEGSGKSTLQAALAERLKQRGVPVRTTREPGGTPLAEAVRSLVLNPPAGQAFSPLATALLMNAARADHLEKLIRPALAAGEAVICDRFSDSTRVYQSVGGGVSMALLRQLETAIVGDTGPDLTIILDAPPEALLARRARRTGRGDVFEMRDLQFHSDVREGFRKIASDEPGRCRLINARLAPDEVAARAMQAIAPSLEPEQ